MIRLNNMVFVGFVLILSSLVLFCGCVCSHVKATDPNSGIFFEVGYNRLFHQEIENLTFKTPSGWKFGFEKQKSPFELGVEFGELKAKIGNSEE